MSLCVDTVAALLVFDCVYKSGKLGMCPWGLWVHCVWIFLYLIRTVLMGIIGSVYSTKSLYVWEVFNLQIFGNNDGVWCKENLVVNVLKVDGQLRRFSVYSSSFCCFFLLD